MYRFTLLATALLLVTGCNEPARAPTTRAIDRAATDSSATDSTSDARDDEPPGEIRRGMRMGPTSNPVERQRRAYESIVRRVEPSLRGDPQRLPQYLEFFKREFVRDPRLFAFNVSAQRSGDAIVLNGYAEYREQRDALTRFLEFLKIGRIDNRLELLPSESLGAKKLAIVLAPHTLVYDRPTKPRETVTDVICAEMLYVLRATDDGQHLLCHTSDGYVGYVAAADVSRIDASALGAPESSSAVAETIERVIAAAHKLDGTKYVWGGKTDEGVDCSGLVQTAFKSQGINLPRDADQQAYVGRLVATRTERSQLRRGDLLYFLSRTGRVNHTAIYLGDGKYLEAAGKGVKTSTMKPSDADYDARRDASFCFAKRVLE